MAAQPVLSYGWIGYDVLAFLQNSFHHSNVDFGVEDESFLKKLEEKMVTVSTKYPEEYGQMKEDIFYDKFLLEWIFDLGSIYGGTQRLIPVHIHLQKPSKQYCSVSLIGPIHLALWIRS